eukprot:CAMPEP_0201514444 /NCGR_PEP_ID=MMETSP0161_2-20130828/6279_1 /ASSEMBLY_ACC=CAM_ASM_000251 /TAXON_ID=180227 /ORGANISM="Neoparamoeba aestuarina, Strain SoJaBio B1-5/56/2" /LENGTH=146 /DNA_ID=CAMNT_0047910997 /DNA_START=241 /DNA_END=681 /DNA_ORIENTATION=+
MANPNASAHLQWLLLRKHNSFMIKKDGITFSREQNNLTNNHSFTSSGLVHQASTGVNVNSKGRVVISARKGKASVGKIATANFTIATGKTNNFPRVARNVRAAGGNKVALARWTKIDRSLKAKKSIAKRRAERKNKKPQESAADLA